MFALRLAALAAALVVLPAVPSAAAQDRVSLTEALTRAQNADPSVPAADARRDAADAGIRQAGKRPNPSLGLEVENFGGTGATRGFDDVETTLSYQQPIELGGKRDARVKLATRERDAAAARGLVARLDLFESVQRAYMEVLAAEAEIALAQERLSLARELDGELGRRIARARDPEFAGARAKTQLADAELGLEQTQLAAKAAQARLASFWDDRSSFRLDARALADTRLPPVDMAGSIGADEQILEAERAAAGARVELERSNAVRDPTLSVGVRHFGASDDVALVVGGSIPLNLFDDNRSAIDRAAAERRAADLDLASYRANRERQLRQLSATLAMLAAEIRQIDETIIPAASRAVTQVRDGFGRGAFGYLDVFEAQNALTDARARRLAALRRFHDTKASLDRLLGTHARLASIGATP